ncbi:MAG TPA: hypothetical protein VD859_13020 [Nocardioides sp.]|nr:hypothetical protein [Nocardioides sp.]
MPISSPVAGAVAGVVVLAGVVGFAVGLPELSGEASSEPSGTEQAELPELPDELPGEIVAADVVVPEQAEAIVERDESAAAEIESLYDTEASVRTYFRESRQSPVQLSVTVAQGEPGLLVPGGPPFDPELEGMARDYYELQRVGDVQCSVQWSQPVPLGEEPDEAVAPAFVECQGGIDGLVYDVFARGATVEEAVGIIDHIDETTR